MVQSLTPFRHATREEEPPLSGVSDMAPVDRLARSVGLDTVLVDGLVRLTENLFAGRFWSFLPIDVRYHDLQHSAQASMCLLALGEGQRRAGVNSLSIRDLELGLAAMMLHDTGFLKTRGDEAGTGAKYTHSHVLRSCALAASVLPPLGLRRDEVDDVLGMIRCTGLAGRPDKTNFSSDSRRLVACMVATSDYIGQMAAPEYPEKLPFLFGEFEEADDFSNIPREKRMFTSVNHLLAATGAFWRDFVLPKLDNDLVGVYRFLETPGQPGRNPYIAAIERNVALITARGA
jgi:hypothetical protein